MANATDSIAENITAICDRLILTRDPKAIAQTIEWTEPVLLKN